MLLPCEQHKFFRKGVRGITLCYNKGFHPAYLTGQERKSDKNGTVYMADW